MHLSSNLNKKQSEVSQFVFVLSLTVTMHVSFPLYAEGFDYRLNISNDRTAHQVKAADKLIDDFFHPNGREDSQPTGNENLGVGLKNPDFPIEQFGNPISVNLEAIQSFEFTETDDISFRFVIGAGQSKYYLPEGIAPFVDPMTLRIQQKSINVELQYSREYANHYIAGGFGLVRTWSKSQLTSALLDVKSERIYDGKYLTLGISMPLFASPLIANVNLQKYQDAQYSLHTSILLDF